MENFEVVDIEKFDRAEYFYYFISTGTTIEFTVKTDVTKAIETCKSNSLNFQAFILFALYKAINSVDNFKYDVLNDKLVKWERIVPTFSSINKNNKLFFTLYADMQDNCRDYNEQYKKTAEKFADAAMIVPQGTLPANTFNVSCVPWLHFEHFSSNSKTMENKIVRMITYGKYKKVNEKFILPMTLQISHAIADGYHVALFFKKLQEELESPIK